MNTGLISYRYACTLLEFSIDNGEEKEVYESMKFLNDVFIETSLLRQSLNDRSVSKAKKKKLMITACGGNIPESLDKMLDLILKNEREDVLHFIALKYMELYRERFDIESAKLITATEMDKNDYDKFLSRIESMSKSKIELETEVNENLIGGFILQVGDYRWDASLKGKLDRLRRSLRGDEEIIKY
ncbi:MAG: F0F1 ATP synthase subunit delta [Fermentimonas sp.]|jgi:F-type H+-transporting ATPase subunit delta